MVLIDYRSCNQQMHLHGRSMADVYKHLDMSIFPDEYLPDDYEGPRVGTGQQIVGKQRFFFTLRE